MDLLTDLVDTAVTPALLLAEVRRARTDADACEARILLVAVEWAHAHPVLDGGEAWPRPRPANRPNMPLPVRGRAEGRVSLDVGF